MKNRSKEWVSIAGECQSRIRDRQLHKAVDRAWLRHADLANVLGLSQVRFRLGLKASEQMKMSCA